MSKLFPNWWDIPPKPPAKQNKDELTHKEEEFGSRHKMPRMIEGAWPEDDIRRAFVIGAKWWEFHCTNASMFPSDQRLAEEEADKRYPNGKTR